MVRQARYFPLAARSPKITDGAAVAHHKPLESPFVSPVERRRGDTDVEHDDIALGRMVGHRKNPYDSLFSKLAFNLLTYWSAPP